MDQQDIKDQGAARSNANEEEQRRQQIPRTRRQRMPLETPSDEEARKQEGTQSSTSQQTQQGPQTR
jgi:hypothetical protein